MRDWRCRNKPAMTGANKLDRLRHPATGSEPDETSRDKPRLNRKVPHMARMILAAVIACLAVPAAASQPGEYKTGPQTEGVAAPINLAPRRPVPMAVMTYETFEATVDHADLPECPKALAAEGRFCRATIHDDALHVFAFNEDLDQPLQAVMDFPMDEIRFPD